MATCANCGADALYAYKVNGSLTIDYCPTHLPKFLSAQRAAGLLAPEAPAPVKSSKKKEDVVEETPSEEVPVTDANN